MSSLYGDFVAKNVVQGKIAITTANWTPLKVGSAPLKDRRQIRLQMKSNPGGAMAIAYAQKNLDGTFTTPTSAVKGSTVYPGNSFVVEPLGDAVMVYGRLVKKKAFSANSITVAITEFA